MLFFFQSGPLFGPRIRFSRLARGVFYVLIPGFYLLYKNVKGPEAQNRRLEYIMLCDLYRGDTVILKLRKV